MAWFRNYRYKGLTLIFISILLTIFLSKYNLSNQFILQTKDIPFFGSFIAGILYVSAFTTTLGVLFLSDLAKTLSPIEIAIVAGVGGAFADFAIFRFVKGDLISEITPIYNKLGGRHLTRLMYHKYFRWSLPAIGAIIIASPLPDEIGISLMGFTKMRNYQFVLLCLALDTIGVFLLVSAFSLINPAPLR